METPVSLREGGWIHYRVFSQRDLEDVEELIKIKKPPLKPRKEQKRSAR